MPGMMETVLDIGLNDASVLGLAKVSGNERFAWDSYRRLVQMFGSTVMGVDSSLFEGVLDDLKRARVAASDLELTAADLATLVESYQDLVRRDRRVLPAVTGRAVAAGGARRLRVLERRARPDLPPP